MVCLRKIPDTMGPTRHKSAVAARRGDCALCGRQHVDTLGLSSQQLVVCVNSRPRRQREEEDAKVALEKLTHPFADVEDASI
jgi:hypothetical protein